jgi:curved DNA-binding protein CbpA
MRKDYYLILHVTPEASFDQIRSAYRRRALELHPDLTGLGSEQFLELQEAYNVLSNPDRRKIYDRKEDETPPVLSRSGFAKGFGNSVFCQRAVQVTIPFLSGSAVFVGNSILGINLNGLIAIS